MEKKARLIKVKARTTVWAKAASAGVAKVVEQNVPATHQEPKGAVKAPKEIPATHQKPKEGRRVARKAPKEIRATHQKPKGGSVARNPSLTPSLVPTGAGLGGRPRALIPGEGHGLVGKGWAHPPSGWLGGRGVREAGQGLGGGARASVPGG